MAEITYIKGKDGATKPVKENALIAHISNNNREWGFNFIASLNKSHPHAKRDYVAMFRHSRPKLGAVSFSEREGYTPVATMIAEDNVTLNLKVRIDHEALRACFKKVSAYALLNECSVHIPKPKKGRWSIVERIIKEELCALGIEVFVYGWA